MELELKVRKISSSKRCLKFLAVLAARLNFLRIVLKILQKKSNFRQPSEPRARESTSDCAAYNYVYYNTASAVPIMSMLEPGR